jgi:hypothetical protein
MQNGHRGAPPEDCLVGAIIGEDAFQNKDKAIWSADVAPPQYTLDELAKEPDARQTAGPIAVSDL